MSDRSRPDLEPEIQLPNRQEQVRRANQALDHGHYVNKVRRRGEPPIADGWMVVLDNLRRRLDHCRELNTGIDEALVLYMVQNCDMARTTHKCDDNGNSVVIDGLQVHILRRVGCRVRMTQDDIAHALKRSRQYVNAQIAILKECYFIVNWGKGWYEFDANLCWRGDLDMRNAYANQQYMRLAAASVGDNDDN